MDDHKDDKDSDTELAQAFLDTQLMEEARRYVTAGRRFQGNDTGTINEKWVVAFRALFFRDDRGAQADMDDLATELRLRDLLPPYDAVRPEIAELQARIRKLGPHAPALGLDKEIDQFFEDRLKPKN